MCRLQQFRVCRGFYYFLYGGDRLIAFIVWTICAAIFLGIGFRCRKAGDAVGFFTFVKPPTVTDVKQYNHAVAALWFAAAVLLEMIGVPLLFIEQNSPLFVPIIFAVMALVIAMMIVYVKIEAKYRK